jgi:glycosyltransferase involved in cell wall biosynthesis
MNTNICFGVRIQTYNRKKQKPIKDYVEETIDCVSRQTYPNWKIFLIGDCYEPRSEFNEFSRLVPPDKIVAVNLHRSPEREIHSGHNLWCCGGMTAFNFSLDLMNELGITHVANLDDDDIWFPRHLEFHARSYNDDENIVMVTTHGHYNIPNNVLPKHKDSPRPFWSDTRYDNPLKSIAGNSCNCACSWDLKRMPLRAANSVQETAWAKQAGDYWFWRKFEDISKEKGYKIVVRPEITVFHRHTHTQPMNSDFTKNVA